MFIKKYLKWISTALILILNKLGQVALLYFKTRQKKFL